MTDSSHTANDQLAAMIANRAVGDQHVDATEIDISWPCLLLRAGKHWFGLRAENVREVVAPEAITRVPSQPPHVLGVSLVHGRLVPVIDISRMFPDKNIALTHPQGRRLAVINHGESELAIIADEAKGVIELPVPEIIGTDGSKPSFILGEVRWENQLVSLFDPSILIELAIGLE